MDTTKGPGALFVIRIAAAIVALALLAWIGFAIYRSQAPGLAGAVPSAPSAPSEPSSGSGAAKALNTAFGFPYTVQWTDSWSYVYNNIDWEDASTSYALTGVSVGTQKPNKAFASAVYSIQLLFKVNNVVNQYKEFDCTPFNMRMVLDEQGDVEMPLEGAWTVMDGCINQATTYFNVPLTFPIGTTTTHFLFTTGNPSNYFFTVDVASDGMITAEPAVSSTAG